MREYYIVCKEISPDNAPGTIVVIEFTKMSLMLQIGA